MAGTRTQTVRLTLAVAAVLSLAGCASPGTGTSPDAAAPHAAFPAPLPADAMHGVPERQRPLVQRGLYLARDGRIRPLGDDDGRETRAAASGDTGTLPPLPDPGADAPASPAPQAPIEIDLERE